MNPLTKLVTIATLWGCIALGIGANGDAAPMGATGLTASLVADAREQLSKAFALERLIRQATARAVVVDGNHMIVESSRLPREVSVEAWRYVLRVASNI